MRFIRSFFACLLVFLLAALPVQAVDFTNSYIRLNNQTKGSSPLPILIVAQPNGALVEDSLELTINNQWTYSGSNSSYTVSTAQLPAGVTAWPGIGTATSVASNTVTFPSSDLTPGTTYGFYLTGGVTANPSSVPTDEALWLLTTKDGVIESNSTVIAVEVVNNSLVTITGSVGPDADELFATVYRTKGGTPFPQGTKIVFDIEYGVTTSNSTPITLQAEWTEGTISGQSSPSVEVVEYVLNTAENAYGNTQPVVDLDNKTITWTIDSFPGETTDTVSFELETTDNYKGSKVVDFHVQTRILAPTTTTDSEVVTGYKYRSPQTSPTPTPTATAPPDLGGGDTIPATPLPTAIPGTTTFPPATGQPIPNTPVDVSTLSFEQVQFTNITTNSFTSRVFTSLPATLSLHYGTSPTQLNPSLSSNIASTQQEFNLSGLSANTTYYVQFLATGNGQQASSDIFTVTTARKDTEITLIENESFVTSNGTPLLTSLFTDPLGTAVIPFKTNYQVTLSFEPNSQLEEVSLFIESKDGSFTTINQYQLAESNTNIFTTQVTTGEKQELYTVFAQVKDYSGGTQRLKLFNLVVAEPFRVYDTQTLKPIERAKINFYRYNQTEQLYKLIEPQTILASNPQYTNLLGTLAVALPLGKYKVITSSLGYQTQETEFEITANTLSYPQIALTPQKISLLERLQYHTDNLQFFLSSVSATITEFSISSDLHQTVSLVVLTSSLLLSTAFLSAKLHVSAWRLLPYLKTHLLVLFTPQQRFLHGKIISKENNQPISNAQVVISDEENQVHAEILTNSQGLFHTALQEDDYLLEIFKPGFISVKKPIDATTNTIEITLDSGENIVANLRNNFKYTLLNFLGFLFEAMLISCFILQLLFLKELPFWQVLPFTILSGFNVITWILFIRSHRFF